MPPDRTPGAAPVPRSARSSVPPRGRASRWLPPLLWTALILVGTSWPSISVGPDAVIGFDKVMHFSVYAVLGVLVRRAVLAPDSLRTLALIVVAVSAFGALDEWHQGFIAGRSQSGFDWLADTLGVITGVLVARRLLPKPPATATTPERTDLPRPLA
jgi:VanZ family protein